MPRKPPVARASRLDVWMVTPEARPFAKTGGLADVAGALPQALARLGHRVTLVMPRYRGIDPAAADTRTPFDLLIGPQPQPIEYVERPLGKGLRVIFVDAPSLFERPGLYGSGADDYADNWHRFAVLSLAALERVRAEGKAPSVIHAHDWQTGLLAVYLRTRFAADPVLGSVPAVFTIHNLAFQGLFAPSVLPMLGLGWDLASVDALEYWGKISYLKGGINFSHQITTVSPTYAREILTPELGFGFEGVLARRASDLVGILNGIDTDAWNPETDPYLPEPYSATRLDGKRTAKRELLRTLGLTVDEASMTRPLIGLVSRLTDQKGFDLIEASADRLMAMDASWAMLGSGDPRYERFWTALAALHPVRAGVRIGFDERLAHLVEAGSDLFLMPSRFEPCGLNQMYSLRYGTLPIVRATGGLDDTVVDADEASTKATGFKFRDYTPDALVWAVGRAIAAYRQPRRWRTLQRAAMRQDHSWDVSAREYVKVYREAGRKRP